MEDDPTIRTFLRETLEKDVGYQVVGEASSGTEMVRTVLDLEPDVVIFDIHLPHQDGLAALSDIYKEAALSPQRRLPQIVTATWFGGGVKEHVLAYLVKPVEAHQLGPALQIAWALSGATGTDDGKRLTAANAAESEDHRTCQGRTERSATAGPKLSFSPNPTRCDEPARTHGGPVQSILSGEEIEL